MECDVRSIVDAYYAALNQRNVDALAAVVTSDFRHHDSGRARDFIDFVHVLEAFTDGFPDLTHEVVEVVVDVSGNQAAARTTTSGTHLGIFLDHPPTGRVFRAGALALFRIANGRVSEIWNVFDTMQMLQQLGLYVPTAVRSPDHASRSITSAILPTHAGLRPPGPAAPIALSEIRDEPLAFVSRLTAKHGDMVSYECEGRLTYLLNTPEALRHVFHERAANYVKVDTPDLQMLRPMLGQGLLTTDGPIWRRDRQRLQPLFNRQRVEQFGDVIVSTAEEMLERWAARSDQAAAVDICREMSRLTLSIVSRALFSTSLTSAESDEFAVAMDVVNEGMGQAIPIDTRRLTNALELIRRTAWRMVLARRIYDSGEDDLITLLLGTQQLENESDAALADQAVTLLLAGHETTAKALAWSFALLDKHPVAGQRLTDELHSVLAGRVPSVSDLGDLNFTRAVIAESLRLYPPVWLISRSALASDMIAGYPVPAGTLISASPYLIQRHPNLWNEANRFRPERFLEVSEDSVMREYRYLPFGSGPRQCIGKHFALLELPLVLTTVWRRYELLLCETHSLETEALVTLRPKNGLPMTIRPRISEMSVSSC